MQNRAGLTKEFSAVDDDLSPLTALNPLTACGSRQSRMPIRCYRLTVGVRGPNLHWSKTQVYCLNYVGSGLRYRRIDYCHAVGAGGYLQHRAARTDERQLDRQIVIRSRDYRNR